MSTSYTTQAVGTVRSVTFSQTVTNALSSVTQCDCVQCNIVVLWAVSSRASAQTVHRPTVAVPSRFWHHRIHSTPKLCTATGTEIALGLGIESYTETGKGARFFFWNMCVHLNQLTILSVCLETILLDRGWPQRGWSKWSKKVNIQLL